MTRNNLSEILNDMTMNGCTTTGAIDEPNNRMTWMGDVEISALKDEIETGQPELYRADDEEVAEAFDIMSENGIELDILKNVLERNPRALWVVRYTSGTATNYVLLYEQLYSVYKIYDGRRQWRKDWQLEAQGLTLSEAKDCLKERWDDIASEAVEIARIEGLAEDGMSLRHDNYEMEIVAE